MSCTPQPPRAETPDSSDYCSDFTPDEEQSLNELLAKAVAQHATVATPISTGDITPARATPAIEHANIVAAADLESLQPAVLDALVVDIEDVEDLPGVRVPKVLGREAPRSPWRRSTRWSPFGLASPFGAGPRASPGAGDRNSPTGMRSIWSRWLGLVC